MRQTYTHWKLCRYQQLLDSSFEYFLSELPSVPDIREFMMFICARGRLDLFNHMIYVGIVPSAECLPVADKLIFDTLVSMKVKPDPRCMYDICYSGDVYKFTRIMENLDFTNTSRLAWLERQCFGHSLLYAAIQGLCECNSKDKNHEKIINMLLFMGLRDPHCIHLAMEKSNERIFNTLLLNGHTINSRKIKC